MCETKACQDWRAQIKDQLSTGWTEAQILDYFVQQYGERVLAEPQRQGFSSLVWVLPVIGTTIALGTISYVLKNWKARDTRNDSISIDTTPVEPEVEARIEEKLNRLR